MACAHCYAPKSRDELRLDTITRWLAELDAHGTLGIGFGGGEPTLYPEFVKLCQYAARETRLSVSFTTHGHHIDSELAERLRDNVHFIRVGLLRFGGQVDYAASLLVAALRSYSTGLT
ncbi:radical SAM protein [Corallococcus exiguus]|nr:radical SAM protein [Corallococcus exiguus]NNC00695.1 radical SAM protein [Corallococcus exiguus]NPC53448.1 radical SAM protein [Corallococcus exiguus]